MPILPWTDEEDVIQRANNTKMRLGASIWSQDLKQANRIARRLEAGNVWINNILTFLLRHLLVVLRRVVWVLNGVRLA